MGLLDLLTIAVAVVGYTIGRSRGLVFQLSGVATLIIGGLSATILSGPLGPLFAEGLPGRFVAWVAIYAVVGICLYVLTLKLKDKIKEMEFEELDKRFGGMLGALKAMSVFGLILLVAVTLSDRLGDGVKDTATGQTLAYLVHESGPLVPDKVHESFERIRRAETDAVTGAAPDAPGAPVRPPIPPARDPVHRPVRQPDRVSPPRDPGHQPLGPPRPARPAEARPNPFTRPTPVRPAPDPDDPLGPPVPEVEPLVPSVPDDRLTEVEPLEPYEDDPFDTSDDPDDPLAPRR